MTRIQFVLLATTGLTSTSGLARADVIFDSAVPFGTSFGTATTVPLGDAVFVGDVNVSGDRYFQIGGLSTGQSVRVLFTAARQTSSGMAFDTLVGGVLPMLPGTAVVTQFGSPSVTAVGGSYEGTSYVTGTVPVLSLYQVSAPAPTGSTSEGGSTVSLVAQATAPSTIAVAGGSSASSSTAPGSQVASSYEVDFELAADQALPFVFNYDFDWTLEVITTASAVDTGGSDVPEPGSLGLLGLGAAAAAMRRRRVI